MSGLTIAVIHCGSVIESSRGAIIWPTNADHQETLHIMRFLYGKINSKELMRSDSARDRATQLKPQGGT
ncbi:MAG TPA: hypothetical protein VIH42_14920 [Thermoguttaceae bacterium]